MKQKQPQSQRGFQRRLSGTNRNRSICGRMLTTYSLLVFSCLFMFSFVYFVQQMDIIAGDDPGPSYSLESSSYSSESSSESGVSDLSDAGDNERRSLFFMPRQKPVSFTQLATKYSLTPQKYDAIIGTQADDPRMIAYFSPWCGHCQQFIPVFVELANRNEMNYLLRNREAVIKSGDARAVKIVFGTVDCVAERVLCRQHRIDAYPTVVARNFPKGIIYSIIYNIYCFIYRIAVDLTDCPYISTVP